MITTFFFFMGLVNSQEPMANITMEISKNHQTENYENISLLNKFLNNADKVASHKLKDTKDENGDIQNSGYSMFFEKSIYYIRANPDEGGEELLPSYADSSDSGSSEESSFEIESDSNSKEADSNSSSEESESESKSEESESESKSEESESESKSEESESKSKESESDSSSEESESESKSEESESESKSEESESESKSEESESKSEESESESKSEESESKSKESESDSSSEESESESKSEESESKSEESESESKSEESESKSKESESDSSSEESESESKSEESEIDSKSEESESDSKSEEIESDSKSEEAESKSEESDSDSSNEESESDSKSEESESESNSLVSNSEDYDSEEIESEDSKSDTESESKSEVESSSGEDASSDESETTPVVPDPSPVPTASPQPVPTGSSLCLCVGDGCHCPSDLQPMPQEMVLDSIPMILDRTKVAIFITGSGSAKLNFNFLHDSIVSFGGIPGNSVNLTLVVNDHPNRFSIENLTVNAVYEVRQNIYQIANIETEEITLKNVSVISGSVRVSLTTNILNADLISLASGFTSIQANHLFLGGKFNEKTITPITFLNGGLIDLIGEFPLIGVGNNKVFVCEDKISPLKHSFENIVEAVIYSSSNQKVKLIKNDEDVDFRKNLEYNDVDGMFPTNLYVPKGGSLTISGRSLESGSSATNNQFVVSSASQSVIKLNVESYFLPFSFKEGTTVAMNHNTIKMTTGAEAARYANTNLLIDTKDEITKINMTSDSIEYTMNDGIVYKIPKSIAENVGPFSSNTESTLDIYIQSGSGDNYIYAANRSLTKLHAYKPKDGGSGSTSVTFVAASNEIEVEEDKSLEENGVSVTAVDEQGEEIDLSKVGIPNTGKNPLSGGAIAGIVIAVVVVVIAIVVLTIFLIHKNNEASSSSTPDTIVPKSPKHGSKKNSGSLETFQYTITLPIDDEQQQAAAFNNEAATTWNGNFW